MSINDRFAAMVPDLLTRHGFDVVLQTFTEGAGDDYTDTDGSWGDTKTLRAVWDKPPSQGSERLDQGRAQSQNRLALLVSYDAALKNTQTVTNKRISYDGTYYNIASVGMIGDKVALSLTLEDGVAQ